MFWHSRAFSHPVFEVLLPRGARGEKTVGRNGKTPPLPRWDPSAHPGLEQLPSAHQHCFGLAELEYKMLCYVWQTMFGMQNKKGFLCETSTDILSLYLVEGGSHETAHFHTTISPVPHIEVNVGLQCQTEIRASHRYINKDTLPLKVARNTKNYITKKTPGSSSVMSYLRV